MKKLYLFKQIYRILTWTGVSTTLSFMPCQGQILSSCSGLHEKYWHYRERLIQNFMLGIGPDQGYSLPAENRDELHKNAQQVPEPTLRWGDASIYLGYYIGVLATEYKLLALEGKPVEQTKKELFYVLHAINPMEIIIQ